MAEKLCSLRKKGGGNSIDPLVIYSRGQLYNQCLLKNEIIKQYKYVKLMTAQEYADYLAPSTWNSTWVNVFSITLTYNFSNVSTYDNSITLTTTPIDVSTLNLADNKYSLFQLNTSTDTGYVIKLYN